MSVDKDGLRAQFSSRAQRQGRVDAELARFVGCRRDHPALISLTPDYYRFAFQIWIEELFHGDKEGVHVDVEDGTGESGLISGRHAMRILAAPTLRTDERQHATLAEQWPNGKTSAAQLP